MKISFRITMCILLVLVVTTVGVSAIEGNQQYTYDLDGTVYTVEFVDSCFTAEQQETVAQRLLLGSEEEAQAYGLGCMLFGHDLKESVVSVITHKVRTYAPRCRCEYYDVTICEDCDYQTQTKTGSSYILCCPEE